MSELPGQLDIFGNVATGNEEYEAFVEKFKAKKTTDDCCTPENIYEAVAEWVSAEYGIERADMVRPFWPGEDYTKRDYPDGCCVVDNPPFSILAKIERFYIGKGIRFFLFAPTMTLFSGRGLEVCYIPCGVQITYANRAKVNTSFVTNLDGRLLRTCPELYREIKRANDENERAARKQLPSYSYPAHVLTAAAAYQYSHYGIDFALDRRDAVYITRLDAMRERGKEIFGGGYLLCERAAAERAAAERAAATEWALSDREHVAAVRLGGKKRPGFWFVFFEEGVTET